MRKRWFLVGAMLLTSLLVVGCGIPQEAYDALLTERDDAQAQVASLESDLAVRDSQMERLESDLEKAESDLATAQDNLDAAQRQASSAQSEASSLRSKMDRATSAWSSLKPRVELSRVILENYKIWLEVELGEMTEEEANAIGMDQWGQISVALDAIGDEELSENIRIGWFAEGGATKAMESTVAFYEVLLPRVESDAESLSKNL